ncbi:MAG: riboflavin synthase [Planctomycetes bacterium]|nr:riboflavin synthase [Planctomycetota bacterium]
MFTGIIQYVGTVRQANRTPGGGLSLAVDIGPLAEGLSEGQSVAVNGACLTAVGAGSGGACRFDVVAETVGRTNLGSLRPGGKVNLERSLKLSDALDGHLVQGHVDGMAQVERVEKSAGTADQWLVSFAAPTSLTDLMVPKGSVAIDGVSLTLVEAAGEKFSVALIPATRQKTTLGGLSAGQAVNIETDVIGKYVLRFMRSADASPPSSASGFAKAAPDKSLRLKAPPESGLTLDKLKDAGFI